MCTKKLSMIHLHLSSATILNSIGRMLYWLPFLGSLIFKQDVCKVDPSDKQSVKRQNLSKIRPFVVYFANGMSKRKTYEKFNIIFTN